MSVVRPETSTIPDAPGAYLFRDEDGRVVYVGKAISLRKRLASYWSRPLHPRTEAMLSAARSVEWIVARTEVDALMLEYNLIKSHRPRFNVRYRDDKSYPYLALTVGETGGASGRLEYERAARLRDKLAAARKAMESQEMVLSRHDDLDVVGMQEDDLEAAFQVFFVRRGRVMGRRGWVVDKVEDIDAPGLVASFLRELYMEADEVPPRVV